MKKLLVVLFILAVVAGGVFAQSVTVGGEMYGKAVMAAGTNAKDAAGDSIDPWAGGGMGRVRLNMSAADKDNEFGAWIRLESSTGYEYGTSFGPNGVQNLNGALSAIPGVNNTNDMLGNVRAYGYAWWQPIPQFRLQVGVNPDGCFESDSIARWSFYDTAGDIGIVVEQWKFDAYTFYYGFNQMGTWVTIAPIKDLSIDIAVPFENPAVSNPIGGGALTQSDAAHVAMTTYKNTNARIAYTIENIGMVSVTYAGGTGDTAAAGGSNGGRLYGYFDFNAVKDLNIELGLGYQLAVTDKDDGGKYNAPFGVGIAATYQVNNAFGFKVRAQGLFGGDYDPYSGDKANFGSNFLVDLQPYYCFSDTMRLYLSLGLNSTSGSDINANVLAWHINPYFAKNMNIGGNGGAFYVGFRIDSDGQDYYNASTTIPAGKSGSKVINWAIPVGVRYAF